MQTFPGASDNVAGMNSYFDASRLLIGLTALVFAGAAVWLFDQHELNVAETYDDPIQACLWANAPLNEGPGGALLATKSRRLTDCMHDRPRLARLTHQYEQEMLSEQRNRLIGAGTLAIGAITAMAFAVRRPRLRAIH
jgi:hypothetical protein